VDIRPRTTGEILDDAWRLALADAPLLLLLSGLFLIPAFTALLVLLAHPVPAGLAQVVLPAGTGLLLALTGVGSGACQELFRCRAEGKAVRLTACLAAALRHGLEHGAARAFVLAVVFPGLVCLLGLFLQDEPDHPPLGLLLLGLVVLALPGLLVWSFCTPVHALIAAGKGRSGGLVRELGREAAFDSTKGAVVKLSRLPLLVFVFVNLELLILAGLWVADNLAGFNTALLAVRLSASNPLADLAIFLLGVLLLAPFFEAVNFLLHLDVRTRQEGADLLYRVQRVFPITSAREPAVPVPARPRSPLAGALLLAVGALLAGTHPAPAGEPPLTAVQGAREGVEKVRDEVKAAEPYPGGRRWEGRLDGLAARLNHSGDGTAGRFRWFERGIEGFAARDKPGALHVLTDLQRRLSLLEDTLARPRQEPGGEGRSGSSKDEIKSLLRKQPEGRKPDRPRPKEKEETRQERKQREEVRRDDADPVPNHGGGGGGGPRTGGGVPGGGAGLGGLGWFLLGGLALAILAVAGALFWSSRGPKRPKTMAATGKSPEVPEPQAPPHEQSPDALWQQADALARRGEFLEAIRSLYLAVLSLLHRRRLLQYEPTRTNGEYVQQVRLAPEAPAELHRTFERLTGLFDLKWYGERACDEADYRACHALAEEVRGQVEQA
jgi:hypothetical protein